MKWRKQAGSHLKAIYQQQYMRPVLAALALIVMLELLKLSQLEVFLFIEQQLLQLLPKSGWEEITWLGDFRILICLLAPWLLMRPRALVAVLIAAPLASLFSFSLKTLFDVRRPYEVLPPIQPELLQAAGNSSFPSGHSLTVAAFMAILYAVWVAPQSQGLRRQMSLALLAMLSLAVMASRMALQAHWPLDVLAGWCVGWWVGSLAYLLTELGISEGSTRVHQGVAAVVLMGASLFLWQHAAQDMPNRQIPFLAAASVWVFLALYGLRQTLQRHTDES